LKHFSKYLFFLLILGWACDNDHESGIADPGGDYFPLRVGFYQRYHVEETRYVQGEQPQTLVYELKQAVVDSFKNADENIVYIIHRSTPADQNAGWQFMETWSARKDMHDAVYVEGNIPYLKLSFPLGKGAEWNGNEFNTLPEDEYEVKDYDVSMQINGMTFDKTLVVEQEFNDDPIVFTDERSEVYARNVGLVKKETTQLVYCQDATCSGNEVIESGVVYKMEILEYGVE
jgi:hypothetical protein